MYLKNQCISCLNLKTKLKSWMMMMYGEGPPPPTDSKHHHTHTTAGLWLGSWRTTFITSLFCVLPLTTHLYVFGSFYVLRPVYCVMPTGLTCVFVHKHLISVMCFSVSVMHFSHSVYKFCYKLSPASKASSCVCVVVFTVGGGWLALPVHHHLVVQNGILGLYFVFVF